MSVVVAAQPIPACSPPPYVDPQSSLSSPDQSPQRRPAYRRFLTSSRRVGLKRVDSTPTSDPSSSSSSLQSPPMVKRFTLTLPAMISTPTLTTRPRAATASQLADKLRSACYESKRRLGGLLVDTPAGRMDATTAAAAASADVLRLQPCSDTDGIAKPCRACYEGERCNQLGSRPHRRRNKPVSDYTLSYRYPAADAAERNDEDADETMHF